MPQTHRSGSLIVLDPKIQEFVREFEAADAKPVYTLTPEQGRKTLLRSIRASQ
jgi:hypothetical protein